VSSRVVKVDHRPSRELYAPPQAERSMPTYNSWKATNKKLAMKNKK